MRKLSKNHFNLYTQNFRFNINVFCEVNVLHTIFLEKNFVCLTPFENHRESIGIGQLVKVKEKASSKYKHLEVPKDKTNTTKCNGNFGWLYYLIIGNLYSKNIPIITYKRYCWYWVIKVTRENQKKSVTKRIFCNDF